MISLNPKNSRLKEGTIMTATDNGMDKLLSELSEARTWSARIKGLMGNGVEVSQEIRDADRRIKDLERRAGEVMKRLGCVSPQTRAIYHAMADMLISWYAFKDALE
jgi:hypothetical protein